MMQKAEPEIVLFSEENLHGVCELTKRCFSSPWSESIYARELQSPQSVGFAAVDGGKVVGFLHCDYVLDELTLNTLCVDAAYRRQGIARALWQAVRELMTGVCTVCYLEVRESNLPARRLYESLGFVQNGYRPRYYDDPEEAAVLMQAEL